VLYVPALWVGDVLQGLLDQYGWAYATVSLFQEVATTPVAVVALVLALTVAWALTAKERAGDDAARLVDPRTPDRPQTVVQLRHVATVGVAAGLAGVCVLLVYRSVVGDSFDELEIMQRTHAYWSMAAAAAASAALALAITVGRRGWGAGLVAGPIAATVVAIGNLGLSAVLNGRLPAETILTTVTADAALGLVLTVAVAAIPLPYALDRPRSSPVGLVVVAVLISGTTTGAVALFRDTALPQIALLIAAVPPHRLLGTPSSRGRTTEQTSENT
jgi:hypothetical protein